jgi:hypothetical protein
VWTRARARARAQVWARARADLEADLVLHKPRDCRAERGDLLLEPRRARMRLPARVFRGAQRLREPLALGAPCGVRDAACPISTG